MGGGEEKEEIKILGVKFEILREIPTSVKFQG